MAAINAGFSGGVAADGGGRDAEGRADAPADAPLLNDARDEKLKSCGRDIPKVAAADFMSDEDMVDRSNPGGRENPAAAAASAM